MTLTGAWLALSPGNQRSFNSSSFFSPPLRIRQDRDPRNERELSPTETHLVGDLLRPREHLLRDHHCVLFKNRKISHTHTDVYTCAHTSGAARPRRRAPRCAAWRWKVRAAGGGSVTSHVCVVRIPTSHPHTPRRPTYSIASKCDVEIGWLASSASLPAYVVAKVDACVEFPRSFEFHILVLQTLYYLCKTRKWKNVNVEDALCYNVRIIVH